MKKPKREKVCEIKTEGVNETEVSKLKLSIRLTMVELLEKRAVGKTC